MLGARVPRDKFLDPVLPISLSPSQRSMWGWEIFWRSDHTTEMITGSLQQPHLIST